MKSQTVHTQAPTMNKNEKLKITIKYQRDLRESTVKICIPGLNSCLSFEYCICNHPNPDILLNMHYSKI